jgi:SAM-dependent methyltransferase
MTSEVNSLSFGAKYAGVYDALYRDKNYRAEARFALDQIRTVMSFAPLEILDLGCGTGQHAVEMARAAICVTGLDRSAEMVTIARNRTKSLSEDLRKNLQFRVGDARMLYLQQRYDAVVALFHVISYMIEDNDLDAIFGAARRHVRTGGAFLFDFWYGPAVLCEPPQPRVKIVQIGETTIERRAIPNWDERRHVVCVNYNIEIRNTLSADVIRESEQHFVRYFFPEEIKSRLLEAGFQLLRFGEWMTGNPPSDDTFSVFAVAKAV